MNYSAMENASMMEQRLKAMLDASPMLCAIYDENYKVIEANQAAATLFGLSDKQYYIDRFYDLCPEYQPDGVPTRDKLLQVLGMAFKEGRMNFEWMHCTLDGKPIPCKVYLERIDLGGKSVVMAYAWDLSEQKDMLAQLEKSLKREQDANNAKTKFLSTVSHEIRTPMNSVLGIAELQIQEDTHPEETKEAFVRIYNSSRLLLSIINDILDISKVEAGKMEIVPTLYETASMIIDATQLNLFYLGDKEVEFLLSVDEGIPNYLIGDETRVKQIINNILSNAFKYTMEGTVRLSFFAESVAGKDDVTLVFSVADTGQGMSQLQLDSLFVNEFNRFNFVRNRTIEGSGIGLTIAHQLTSAMGGTILVESKQGKGSKFTVRLPQKKKGEGVLGREVSAQLRNLESASRAVSKTLSTLKREPMPYGRVLVVDDAESNLHVAKIFLTPYEIEVETAESGAEAIAKIKAGEVYDIIFMDYMMPDMDGIKTTKILRNMGYSHPVVALTANALNGVDQMFLENDFSGFISKPISPDKLDEVLLRFIRDKQPVRTPKATGWLNSDSECGEDVSAKLEDSFLRDAKKSLKILAAIAGKEALDAEALNAYSIQAHAMKSALHHVGRLELSETAHVLETAGRSGDEETIRSKTPAFLDSLRGIIMGLELRQELLAAEEQEEDPEFLRNQLVIIGGVCETLDIERAIKAIDKIRQKGCARQTRTLLNDIEECLLCGDFEGINSLVERAIS